MKAEIEAAVKWWQDALRSECVQDNGDVIQSAIATWARERQPKPTEQQIEDFGSALTTLLLTLLPKTWERAKQDPNWGAGTEGRFLDVDYGPGVVLSAAAQAAGIQYGVTLFPIKTVMRISPGNVTVRQGYGSSPEMIYPDVPNNSERS